MKKIYLFWMLGMLIFPAMAQEKSKKALFVIVDGIPADVIEEVSTPNIDAVIEEGGYARAVMGGDVGTYSETPTISAVGYNSLLTGTWANKHNVWGNDIKAPNYHYWTIFRLYKETFPQKKTAIFSTWLDNRTKLVGANLPATGNYRFDYYYDGMELDTLHYPHDDDRLYIHHIDEAVSKEAASYIQAEGPDLSWLYLEYSDDMGHKHGDGPEMVDGVKKVDVQIGRIWEAVKYRQAHFEEDWLLVITTDHGRSSDGHGHGGQSERERTIWIATNAKNTNAHFSATPEMVDILPSLAKHLQLDIPKKQAMELDGVPFIGAVDAANFQAVKSGKKLHLTWENYQPGMARVWIATTNHFNKGGLDNYWDFGTVDLAEQKASIDLLGLESGFYKVVLETSHGYLNYWMTD